ncbi:hypothetical protein ABH926_001595 [Catenulispora sp. GP43]|uniref:hypothetical protein n=1 Tax=Catenulispora sp. GP43 TaxID=3156263 RepID=UPI0035159353
MNVTNHPDDEIGRPGYHVDRIRHLTPGNTTRPNQHEPKGFLRIRAVVATGLTLYAWTWPTGLYATALWTTAAAAGAAMKTARHSADPNASDLSLTLATIARYTAAAWLLYVIPTTLYTMHADGIAAMLTYLFKTA